MSSKAYSQREPTIVVLSNGEEMPRMSDLERLARWMDSALVIPGIRVPVGFDALIGLVPGLGDTLTAIVSLYILKSASRYGVPRITLLRMGMNIAIDLVAGSLPLVGDLFDVAWRANTKNVALLKAHVQADPSGSARARRADWVVVLGVSAAIILVLCAALWVTYWIMVTVGRAVVRVS